MAEGNGRLGGQGLMAALARRWNEVTSGVDKRPAPQATAPVPPSREEIRDKVIARWAMGAPPEFFEWLADRERALRYEAGTAVDSHGRLAYFTGFEDAVSDFKSQFTRWTKTSG